VHRLSSADAPTWVNATKLRETVAVTDSGESKSEGYIEDSGFKPAVPPRFFSCGDADDGGSMLTGPCKKRL
jgi:hypothetical protein